MSTDLNPMSWQALKGLLPFCSCTRIFCMDLQQAYQEPQQRFGCWGKGLRKQMAFQTEAFCKTIFREVEEWSHGTRMMSTHIATKMFGRLAFFGGHQKRLWNYGSDGRGKLQNLVGGWTTHLKNFHPGKLTWQNVSNPHFLIGFLHLHFSRWIFQPLSCL